MRHRWTISVRASVALFFFLGLGNEFYLSKKHIHAVYAIKCKVLKKKIMS